jgi:hypothetical protein
VILARFIVNGEERETREVEQKWLLDAWADQGNVLLKDGNPYRIQDVHFDENGASVELVAPRVTPAG